MPKPENIAMVAELSERLQAMPSFLLTDYRGLTVPQMQQLRRRLESAGAKCQVVKNRLFLRAAEQAGHTTIAQWLEGPTAVVFVSKDPASVAKSLQEFHRVHRLPLVKGGVIEGRPMMPEQFSILASLPPRERLLAELVGAIQGPMAGLVTAFQGLLGNLALTLQSLATKKLEASG